MTIISQHAFKFKIVIIVVTMFMLVLKVMFDFIIIFTIKIVGVSETDFLEGIFINQDYQLNLLVNLFFIVKIIVTSNDYFLSTNLLIVITKKYLNFKHY